MFRLAMGAVTLLNHRRRGYQKLFKLCGCLSGFYTEKQYFSQLIKSKGTIFLKSPLSGTFHTLVDISKKISHFRKTRPSTDG